MIWNAPENSKPYNNENINDKSSDICRIYVDPLIKSTIKLDDIFIADDGIMYASNKNMAGISYPVICINNHFIKSEEIDYLEINCENMIPSIYLQITPISDSLLYLDPPKDGDIISVFIRTTTDVIVPLRCDFIIRNNSNETVQSILPHNNKMILSGMLFIPGIYSELNSFAKVGTSLDVLKSISKKLKLGFATNEMDQLNDKQLWICPKDSLKDFIEDVVNHAWLDEQSFYKSWIDIYYNLNFVNINKMLISSDTEVDITAASSIQDIQKIFPIDTSETNAQSLPKMFTNAIQNMRPTSFYITEWTPYNQSSKITEKYGSRINTHEFFHNQNIYNSNDDPYVSLMNTQMYDPNKIESHILLRGRSNYNADIADENDMAHENIKSDDINTHSIWSGVQYVMSEDDNTTNDNTSWSGNVHKNYNRANIHNLLNNKELDKMYIKIKVVGPCLQVLRGEKVPVVLSYSPGVLKDTINNNSTGINKLYSGMYIVDGYKITYKHKLNDAGFSGFNTEFILKRREWPAPVDVQKE